MHRTLIAAMTLTLLALPGAARAHWEWTTWGMSRDEVVAGSGGRVSAVEGGASQRVTGWDLMAQGELEYDSFVFKAQFYFDPEADDLHVVRLTLQDVSQCQRLRDRVAERYGPVRATTVTLAPAFTATTQVWPDNGEGDVVWVTSTNPPMEGPPAACLLILRPASKGGRPPLT